MWYRIVTALSQSIGIGGGALNGGKSTLPAVSPYTPPTFSTEADQQFWEKFIQNPQSAPGTITTPAHAPEGTPVIIPEETNTIRHSENDESDSLLTPFEQQLQTSRHNDEGGSLPITDRVGDDTYIRSAA